ncbi:MAG: hypothetical protein LBQ62_04965 [Candidatus Accumulibacter sp.]|nr:hypothetical protein [Accumulibacter sp.]
MQIVTGNDTRFYLRSIHGFHFQWLLIELAIVLPKARQGQFAARARDRRRAILAAGIGAFHDPRGRFPAAVIIPACLSCAAAMSDLLALVLQK